MTDAGSWPQSAIGKGGTVRQEYNVLALVKGDEHYVFVYDDDSRQELLKFFHEQAADDRLTLNWFDAAVLTEKAWEQAGQTTPGDSGTRRF
jgi:hypothetical protein